MTAPAMILVTEPDAGTRAQLVSDLAGTGPVTEIASLAEAADAVDRHAAAVACVVLGPGLVVDDALEFIEKEASRSATPVLLVARDPDAQLLRRALRAGVDDVLTPGADRGEWHEALARALSRAASEQHRASDEPDTTTGQVVSVFSTKGGVGKSMVASNLAMLAAAQSQQALGLLDLDLQSGDLAIMLQLMPELSIHDAAQSVGNLDAEAIGGYLTPHTSGAWLLAAPMDPSLADQIRDTSVSTILGLLRSLFPLTIVDGPPLFTNQMLAALDVSDQVVLVGTMEVPSIKNLYVAFQTLTQLGHTRENLRVVINRADSKSGLRIAEIEQSLGTKVDVQIPSSRDVPLSINQGIPMALSRPKSPVVAALTQLLEGLVEPADETTSRGRARRR